jgi:hypothetical protein
MRLVRVVILLLVLLLLSGCFRPQVIRHPDAPMLVTGARRGYLRVSVYDKINNRMIDAGWVRGSDVEGWTVSRYDWETYLHDRR